jgi:putative membrane protein
MKATYIPKALASLMLCVAAATPALAAKHVPDMKFMKAAAMGGLFEVQMGKIADEKGDARGVRQFGKHMVVDHTRINHDLKMIAREEHVKLPSGIGMKNARVEFRLYHLHGMAFDHAYIDTMISAHNQDLAAFRHEAKDGKNPTVRTFANQNETIIQGHLMMAHQLHTSGGKMGA